MIIDLILDRKDCNVYNAKDFYFSVLEYESTFSMDNNISMALDYGTETDIKRALCQYIDNNEYNPAIKKYINSVDWLV